MSDRIDRLSLENRSWLWVAILVCFFLNLWGVPLFDLDEGAFSEATREMFLRGDFISTYLNGLPRNDKPILIYWLQAISVTLFGLNEFGLRLPSALSATAWVWMVYYFVARLLDRRRALLAALVTATTLEILVMGKAATADALFNLCVASALLFFYLYYHGRQRRDLYLTFLAISLGFLTKGPAAPMILLMSSLIFCLWQREWRFWLQSVFNPVGIVIFLVVGVGWYLVSYLHDGGIFLEDFLFTHNFSRFGGAKADHGHGGGIHYYVPVVLLGVLPYTSVLLLVLRRVPQLLKEEMPRYLLIWFGFVFVFFSLSGTKLPHYVVYGYTALTILMGLHLDQLKNRWLTLLPPVLFLLVLALVPEILDLVKEQTGNEMVKAMLEHRRNDIGKGYRWITLSGLLMGLFLLFDRRLSIPQALVAQGLVIAVMVATALLPAVAAIQQEPIREVAALAREKQLEVVQWHLSMPSFNVYSETISPLRVPQPGDYVLTKLPDLKQLDVDQQLYNRNGIVLVKLKD